MAALVLAVALAVAGVAASQITRPAAVPPGTLVNSAHGIFRASYATSIQPIAINTMHTWTLRLMDAEGRPVPDAIIGVSGDMPGHGHGLPTSPVARAVGGGDYVIEGMQFQMNGDWYIELRIHAGGREDTLRIDFTI
jgi:hypothetical protein